MKPVFTLFLLFVFLYSRAQQPIEVKIEQRPSSVGLQPAFEMAVPQATSNEAIDLWKETIIGKKLFQKSPKMEKIKDEWWANTILISDITSSPLNVITQVSTFTGQIYIRIFLQNGNDFLGSPGSPEQTTEAASRFIRNYGVELYRLAVGKELKEEERKLNVLENELRQLTRKNDSYGNKIDDVQKDKMSSREDADYQKKILENDNRNTLGVLGEVSREDVADQLKDAQKDIKKAENEEQRLKRKVSKNEKNQKDKAYEIEKQKEIVEQVKTKLENIR